MRDQLRSEECARLLKALADPKRLQIVQCLQEGPHNVGELSAMVEQDIVNVSHHLGVLRKHGLVQDQKQGRHVIYSLHPNVVQPLRENQVADCLDLGCCRLQWGHR